MPSKSLSQARLMQAVAHNKGFAKKVGIQQNVGREFAAADAAKGVEMKAKGYGMARGAKRTQKFAEGGETGRFDEDTYARARKFVSDGGDGGAEESAPASRAKPKAAESKTKAAESKTKAAESKTKTSGTAAGTGASMRASDKVPKPFARIPGPSEGSSADKAIKTYEPPSEEAQREALKTTAGKMSMLVGAGAGPAAARGVGAAVRGMAKPATEATAKIGTNVAKTAAERTAPKMDVFGAAKRSPARKAAQDAPEGVKAKMNEFGAAKRSPARKKPEKSDTYEVRGEYLAKGGSVRGGGCEQRGKSKGTMR